VLEGQFNIPARILFRKGYIQAVYDYDDMQMALRRYPLGSAECLGYQEFMSARYREYLKDENRSLRVELG
jgi:hypothetical protein